MIRSTAVPCQLRAQGRCTCPGARFGPCNRTQLEQTSSGLLYPEIDRSPIEHEVRLKAHPRSLRSRGSEVIPTKGARAFSIFTAWLEGLDVSSELDPMVQDRLIDVISRPDVSQMSSNPHRCLYSLRLPFVCLSSDGNYASAEEMNRTCWRSGRELAPSHHGNKQPHSATIRLKLNHSIKS